jgi:tripartite-type tricarboxylate transporter receptor subunit TctC
VLLVHPSLPARNVQELIAFLKANNSKYRYAHSGIGTTSHLSGEMFKHSQDLDLVSVPFAGAAQKSGGNNATLEGISTPCRVRHES